MRIRFAPTYVGRYGMRTFMRNNQGRDHFDAATDAQAWLDAVLTGTSGDTIRQLYGDAPRFAVSWILCWDHGDAVGVYPNDDQTGDPPTVDAAIVRWIGADRAIERAHADASKRPPPVDAYPIGARLRYRWDPRGSGGVVVAHEGRSVRIAWDDWADRDPPTGIYDTPFVAARYAVESP